MAWIQQIVYADEDVWGTHPIRTCVASDLTPEQARAEADERYRKRLYPRTVYLPMKETP